MRFSILLTLVACDPASKTHSAQRHNPDHQAGVAAPSSPNIDEDGDTEDADDTDDTDDTDATEDTGLRSFTVTGTVRDADGSPVQDAFVLIGGDEGSMVRSATDGTFSVWFQETGLGEPALIAAKQGYRAIGHEFLKPDTPVDLVLRAIHPPDNEDYIYQDPGNGFDSLKEDCSHCHTNMVLDFMESKHAESTRNPLLQDLYAGVNRALGNEAECTEAGGHWALGIDPGSEDAIDKCYVGGGVLPDLNPHCGGTDQPACDDPGLSDDVLPMAFGQCADCHAPGIDGVAGGRDLHDAMGVAYEIGVHCDTCHKVKDVDLSKPPGVGNRLIMGRPNEEGFGMFPWRPVYYGPILDVPNVAMGGSYQPKFNESQFCAGCHEQNQDALLPDETLDAARWPDGLPVHSTFSEWEDGPYNQEATQCQFCHMPANTERMNSIDIADPSAQSITFGFPRPMEDNRLHQFQGPLQGEPRLIDTALYVSIAVHTGGGQLDATVSVANIGCGHAIPTGEPMRALHLVIEAEGSCGTLEATGGMTITDGGGAWIAGEGDVEVTASGANLTWPDAAHSAMVDQVVRVVRPSGDYDDYAGVGPFADASLDPEDKGMEVHTPIGQATVIGVDGPTLTLTDALDIQAGDWVYLGDAWSADAADGDAARHLAGRAGYSFAKVLLDGAGERHVPHYRATDIASDNRIAPGTNSLTQHSFSLPSSCADGEVRATVLYRPVPLSMAQARGWEAKDYIVATASKGWGD